jgi:predicted nucleotidyltransferase
MPQAKPASGFYHPLDEVLGTLAAVRVLRALTLYGNELSVSAIARQARLTRAGASRAINRLAERGVLRPLGQGGSVLYRLDPEYPLVDAIRLLFVSEAERANRFFAGVRSAIASLDPGPLAVWLFGSVARGEDRSDSDVDLAIVGDPGETRRIADGMREELERMHVDPTVHVSVVSFTIPELRKLKREKPRFWESLNDDAVPLYGPAPAQLLSSKSRR